MKNTKLVLKNIEYRKEILLKDVESYIETIENYQKALKKAENELIELSEEKKLLEKFLKENEQ